MSALVCLHTFKHCANVLESKGYRITEEVAEGPFIEEMAGIGKVAPSAPLRRDTTDLTGTSSYWLALRRGDDLVGTVAARVDDVDDFEDFAERGLRRYWLTDPESQVSVTLPEHLRRMRGQLVYMGDMFFRKGESGDREKTFCFVHAAHCLTFVKWPRATMAYAFLRAADGLVKCGEYGFTSGIHYDVAEWVNPPTYRSSRECLAMITRADFESNMAALIRRPDFFSALPMRRPRDHPLK